LGTNFHFGCGRRAQRDIYRAIGAGIHGISQEVWMHRISGILTALAFLCLFLSRALASDPDQNNSPRDFSVFGSAQTNPATYPNAAAANQFPSVVPGVSTMRPQAMTGKDKFRRYLQETYGLESIAFSVAGAGISQARDNVPEWGQGMEGYGKRLGSRLARRAIKHSIQAGIGSLLHEDPSYFASKRNGIWQRGLYAAAQIFLSHKDSGGSRPAYSRFIGIVSGTCISRQWRPEGDRTIAKYISASAIWLGMDAAKNVFSEFWPDIKKKIRR
jgi:hypothetical protein